jgi:hypothetical protein
MPGVPVYSWRLLPPAGCFLPAGLRVHWAPGIPHALFRWAEWFRASLARKTRGENAELCFSSFRGDAKHRTRNLEIPGLVLRTIPE